MSSYADGIKQIIIKFIIMVTLTYNERELEFSADELVAQSLTTIIVLTRFSTLRTIYTGTSATSARLVSRADWILLQNLKNRLA